MGRLRRSFVPGLCYHVIQRSNARRAIFNTDVDRKRYLQYLQRAALMQACDIHSWVLMSNHVHLIVSMREGGDLSRLFMQAHGAYGRYLNHTLQVEGKVWGARFKASLIEEESYLLSCLAYIDLNPVRAGLCRTPGEWRWSSHRRLAYGDADEGLLTPLPYYQELRRNDRKRQLAYRQLVGELQSRSLKQQDSLFVAALQR